MTSTMTEPTETDVAFARTKQIGAAALSTTAIAVVAGLCMLVLDPDPGSTTEAVLGVTAAISGLLTAALVVGAAISAHVGGLWGRLPVSWRYLVWALLAVGIVRTIWSQISHLG